MKKGIWLGIALLLLLSCLGCKAINKLTIFSIDYDTQTTISSLVGINLPFNVLTPAITTNSTSEFEVNETRKDMIEEITLKRLQLRVADPENGDLSFLKSIEIYVNGDGLEEKRIAWNNAVDTNEKSIDLETSPDDLQDFIKLDTISFRVHTTIKKLLLSDYAIDIHSEFRVDAKILGI